MGVEVRRHATALLFSTRIIIRYNLQFMILQIKYKAKHVYLMNKITEYPAVVKEMTKSFA